MKNLIKQYSNREFKRSIRITPSISSKDTSNKTIL